MNDRRWYYCHGKNRQHFSINSCHIVKCKKKINFEFMNMKNFFKTYFAMNRYDF